MHGIAPRIKELLGKTPGLIKPHMKVEDIAHLNFKKMKEMGME